MRLRVEAPATVANLGPGFDCLGLAVDLVNEVELETDVEPSVTVAGEGAGELAEDATNLIVRSMAYLAQQAGGRLPAFALRCVNRIPLARGLGSSATAVVAGLLLADRLLGAGLGPDRLLEIATDLEGHADNVAPALGGGVVLAHLTQDGWRAEPVPVSSDLQPVLLIPERERISTEDARRVLPREVPRQAATFNAARTALLVLALGGRVELLAEALQDRLHQAARLRLAPGAQRVFTDLQSSGIAVCVAGSGPTLLAFDDDARPVPDPGPSWRVVRTRIREHGAQVRDT